MYCFTCAQWTTWKLPVACKWTSEGTKVSSTRKGSSENIPCRAASDDQKTKSGSFSPGNKRHDQGEG